ncbi:retinal-specific phospholipid-transporting ATPase ABCA4 [Teleopsis dalmanni]|uniref:retinal-specific phospholipid-transporting ATPase ABCA4 n=1 Tax=Teleopsis dalmanni TaxID=139649 RepID=UPI0018CD672E|nr:retinal-specific phospholipid-transporting ATPase ABCA4 [Teleopsis dalmanni]
MKFWSLFRVFLWKNVLFLIFNCVSLAVILVGCYGILVLYLKSTYQNLNTPNIIYSAKNTESLVADYFHANDGDFLYYSPTTPFIDDLMEDVRQQMEISYEIVKPIANASEFRVKLEEECKGNCFAIEFKTISDDVNGNLSYSISSTALKISPKKRYVNDEEVSGIKDDDDYIRSGFLTLQHIIDKNYIRKRSTTNNLNYEMELSSIPTIAQEVLDSQRLILFGSLFSILFSVLLLSTFLVPLVEEKQDGLKEFLLLATPLNFLNGVTFFVLRLVIYLIFFTAVIITAWIYNALGIGPMCYIVLLFVLYMLSAMSYTYLISVCFNSVFYAKVGGLILLVMPYIFYLVKGTFATYLFSTKAFMDGIKIFQTFTNKHRSFSAHDLFANITDSSFSIISIYILLIMQCLFYALIYNYLSCVFPGKGGIKKPYNFIFKRSFYKKPHRNVYTTTDGTTDAIIIQDLCKKFQTPRRDIVIADHLNMTIKNKQITVLLGHNGVGKTTTLNMIIGSARKDAGSITVCSERDVSSYRHLIGFCPQHSVFMQYMTCSQHLQFFAQLRDMTTKEAKTLSNSLLNQLKLEDKADEYGKNLSGGMKRRLSLGIAIAGNTKVIVLDEPSSGLDIESRREFWDILLQLRKTKAVLVTTHHMEEAEVLGDTICILSSGRLQRTGSPLELKRKVGSGYILKLSTRKSLFKEQQTMELIHRFIPGAQILNIVPPTVLIGLSYEYKVKYSELLRHLEEAQQHLGINSISVTDTSLEDVFLNCVPEIDQVDCHVSSNGDAKMRVPYKCLEPTTQIHWMQHFKAIAYKKSIFLKSGWKYTTFMLLFPFVAVSLAMLLMHSMALLKSEDVLTLNLAQIKEGLIYISNPLGTNKAIENLLTKHIEEFGITASKLELQENNSLAEELISLQQKELAYFLQNVIGAIELKTDENGLKFNIFFSGNIYHSSVILMNLIDNAVLKQQTSEKSTIETNYVPIKRFITDVSPTRLEYYAVIVPIGMFFCMFFYVSLPFRENKSGFKNLQPIPHVTYWVSVFIYDVLLHMLVCLLFFGYQFLLMPQQLYTPAEQYTIVASIFFYGISYLPILYCFANSFRSISTISTYLLFMLIISAIAPLITSGNIQSMKYHETKIFFLSILPDFNLNHQLRVINELFFIERRNQGSVPDLNIATFFTYAIFITIIMMILFIIFENKEKRQALQRLFSCYTCRQVTAASNPLCPEEEENLVQIEKATVQDILKEKVESDIPLLVCNLSKSYDRKAAVCDLNFVVRKQECFGLLGVNGAGKTTTFQMISANTTITHGTIKIDGVDILDNEIQYKYRFGYCPQNDCLNNFMTAYQLLKYMAQLRNISGEENLHNEVMFWIEQLDLDKYTNVKVRHYSGGTKRKLNAALAMIGSPSLVLLDEPTTGVDPVSRRFLWKCIQDFQKRDKTIVLTSHSMDECEQLCNRLAIMADGRFKCIGYVPDLKVRYGSGFTIKIKMKVDDCEVNVRKITTKISNQFPDSDLRENHAGMLTYYIKNIQQISWSNVFDCTERFFTECKDLIEDYSVNEPSLEDIFLKFETSTKRKKPSHSHVEDV